VEGDEANLLNDAFFNSIDPYATSAFTEYLRV
jgi:hypothetical protein